LFAITSEFLETTFLTTAGKRSEQSLPLAIICGGMRERSRKIKMFSTGMNYAREKYS